MRSTTALTLKVLRKAKFHAEVVEKWVGPPRQHDAETGAWRGTGVRKDLWGIVDILGVGLRYTLAVQSTSDRSLVRERQSKALASEPLLRWMGQSPTNIFEVWGWLPAKKGQRGRQLRRWRLVPGSTHWIEVEGAPVSAA